MSGPLVESLLEWINGFASQRIKSLDQLKDGMLFASWVRDRNCDCDEEDETLTLEGAMDVIVGGCPQFKPDINAFLDGDITQILQAVVLLLTESIEWLNPKFLNAYDKLSLEQQDGLEELRKQLEQVLLVQQQQSESDISGSYASSDGMAPISEAVEEQDAGTVAASSAGDESHCEETRDSVSQGGGETQGDTSLRGDGLFNETMPCVNESTLESTDSFLLTPHETPRRQPPSPSPRTQTPSIVTRRISIVPALLSTPLSQRRKSVIMRRKSISPNTTKLKDDLEEALAENSSQLRTIRSQAHVMAQLQEKLKHFDAISEELAKAKEELQQKTAEAERAERLQTQLDSALEKISDLEEEAAACESLRAANDALQEEVEAVKNEVLASSEKRQEVRDRVSKLKMELTDCSAALAAKTEEVDGLLAEQTMHEEKIKELKQTNRSLKEEIQTLKAATTDTALTEHSLREEVESLKRELHASKAEHSQCYLIAQKVDIMQSELSEADGQYKLLQDRLGQRERTIVQLKTQLKEQLEETEELQEELDLMCKESEVLNRQLADFKAKVDAGEVRALTPLSGRRGQRQPSSRPSTPLTSVQMQTKAESTKTKAATPLKSEQTVVAGAAQQQKEQQQPMRRTLYSWSQQQSTSSNFLSWGAEEEEDKESFKRTDRKREKELRSRNSQMPAALRSSYALERCEYANVETKPKHHMSSPEIRGTAPLQPRNGREQQKKDQAMKQKQTQKRMQQRSHMTSQEWAELECTEQPGQITMARMPIKKAEALIIGDDAPAKTIDVSKMPPSLRARYMAQMQKQ
eukprot:m.103439 g.103439  ORF g.103439 m.103439 type:complete len:808 (+) comp13237_c1_seq1:68-2491(+)